SREPAMEVGAGQHRDAGGRAPKWLRVLQRPRVKRLLNAVGVLLLWWFVGSPLVGWIGYQAITPSGWHNASVHGHVTSMHYAVSQDVPGLMLACGPRVEHVLRLQFV